jgi:hypothetical protein
VALSWPQLLLPAVADPGPTGKFDLLVRGGHVIDPRLEAELTVRKGRVVWDLNGMYPP